MQPVSNSDSVEWQSLSYEAPDNELIVSERFDRFKLEALTEVVLRIGGVGMITGAILLWKLLPESLLAGLPFSQSLLIAAMAATGLFIFAYGTRGFRRQMMLDTNREILCLTKINMNGQSRVARLVPVDRIESLFVRRPKYAGEQASLYVRIKAIPVPVCVISGDLQDVEALHEKLCSTFKPKQTKTPKPLFKMARKSVAAAKAA